MLQWVSLPCFEMGAMGRERVRCWLSVGWPWCASRPLRVC